MSIPEDQQDYFKYYQLLKGNFYKSASALKALLSDSARASELLTAATAVAVLFADITRSVPDRLAITVVDDKNYSERALLTKANSMLSSNYATLTEALGINANVNAMMADAEVKYAMLNLPKLFARIVAIAQASIPALLSTVRFKEFYRAYYSTSWAGIYANVSESSFTSMSVTTKNTYSADISSYVALLAARFNAGDYTKITSASYLAAPWSTPDFNTFYYGEKYNAFAVFSYTTYSGTSYATYGCVIHDKTTNKMYIYYNSDNNLSGTANLGRLNGQKFFYFNEDTMQCVWLSSAYRDASYNRNVTLNTVVLDLAKETKSGEGIRLIVQLGNIDLIKGCEFARNAYGVLVTTTIAMASEYTAASRSAWGWIVTPTGDINSMGNVPGWNTSNIGQTYMIPYSDVTYSFTKPPVKEILSTACIPAFNGFLVSTNTTETERGTTSHIPPYWANTAFSDVASQNAGVQTIVTAPTTIPNWYLWMGITNSDGATLYEYYQNPLRQYEETILLENGYIVLSQYSITYKNASSLRTTTPRWYAFVFYRSGGNSYYAMIRLADISKIKYASHMQAVEITGVLMTQNGVLSGTYTDTTETTYSIKKGQDGSMTFGAGAITGATTFALADMPRKMNLLTDKFTDMVQDGSNYKEFNLFP